MKRKTLTLRLVMTSCLLVVALTIVGCGVSYYVQPPLQGNAQLTIKLSAKPRSFNFFEDGLECSGILVLTNSTVDEIVSGKAAPLTIPANKEFAFEVLTTNKSVVDMKWCGFLASFFPEPNGRYKLSWVDNQEKESCSVKITKFVADEKGETEIREPSFKIRNERRPLSPGGTHCFPL